jgi:heat shock protein HtpX
VLTYLRRAGLFLLTNLAVVVPIGLILRVTGLDAALTAVGLNPGGLLLWCGLFGLAGAIVSLLLSKWLALRSTGAQRIEQPGNRTEAWLLDTVHRHAEQVGIGAPDVALYDAPEPNAFATGAHRDAALVAVSTGLLRSLDRREVEAVLAHEVSHIANGDMVTMALLHGVTNTFVLFSARIVGALVDPWLFGDRRADGPGFRGTTIVAELVFGLFASAIVMAYSRHREFRADEDATRLVGNHAMIAALERLDGHGAAGALPRSLAAFGIRGARWTRWLASHPPISARIAALEPEQSERFAA